MSSHAAIPRRKILGLTIFGGIAMACSPMAALAKWQSVASPLPSFSLPSLTGDEITLKSLAGRVVLVNFWATWCPPCVEEFADLAHLQHTYGQQGLTVVAINLGESAARIRKFLQEQSIAESELLIGLDNASMLSKRWGVRAVPTTFLINRQGQAKKVWSGAITVNDGHFMKELRRVL